MTSGRVRPRQTTSPPSSSGMPPPEALPGVGSSSSFRSSRAGIERFPPLAGGFSGEARDCARDAVAAEGDLLREHRRFDACEAPQDHRRVEIAEMADAERLAL